MFLRGFTHKPIGKSTAPTIIGSNRCSGTGIPEFAFNFRLYLGSNATTIPQPISTPIMRPIYGNVDTVVLIPLFCAKTIGYASKKR